MVNHRWTALLLLGLGAAGLSGCYVVSPYAYPPYAPYPPPAYAPPPPQRAAPPASTPSSPGGTSGQTPAAPGSSPGAAKGCQMVTVEAHYETRVRQGGQSETVWVPAHQEQVCQ
jgi:hypothetical protein